MERTHAGTGLRSGSAPGAPGDVHTWSRGDKDGYGTSKDPAEQERWENIGGYSPATIAAEIAGLVCAARIARINGDADRAATYLETADAWERQVEAWTLTTNGPLSDQPYYLRITETGNPDEGTELQISDGGPLVDQRRILDPSFLELVHLGIRPAEDPHVLHTLNLVDRHLSYRTPNGRFWHRASFDGTASGATAPSASRSTRDRGRRSDGAGRFSAASAVSGRCSRRGPRSPTWTRGRAPPTTRAGSWPSRSGTTARRRGPGRSSGQGNRPSPRRR